MDQGRYTNQLRPIRPQPSTHHHSLRSPLDTIRPKTYPGPYSTSGRRMHLATTTPHPTKSRQSHKRPTQLRLPISTALSLRPCHGVSTRPQPRQHERLRVPLAKSPPASAVGPPPASTRLLQSRRQWRYDHLPWLPWCELSSHHPDTKFSSHSELFRCLVSSQKIKTLSENSIMISRIMLFEHQ